MQGAGLRRTQQKKSAKRSFLFLRVRKRQISGIFGRRFCPEAKPTIPQSAIRQPAPFAQGSHGVGRRRNSFMPPLMIGGCHTPPHTSPYGKGRCHGAPTHTSPYGKGRCHKVTEGIRVNPQKERHLLCSFCPYSARSAAGKEGNFAPTGQRGRRDLAAYAARTRLSLR